MGLISATSGSISGVVGDQFKEYVTCPAADKSVLVARGVVNHGDGNKNPTEGVITNGSKIVVPQGYAMMIIDNGEIKEFSAEPGEFIWDTSSEPSVFEGGFFKGIADSIKKIGNRITYGGHPARDQRVYYISLLTMTENKFGSPNPETVLDPVYGSVEITFNGMYSFKVVDPTVLVANLIGTNAKDQITVDEVVGGQLKLTFISNVSVCISKVMTEGNISFNTVQTKKTEIANEMNSLLDESWRDKYGLEIQDVALVINASEESKAIIREVDADISRERRRGEMYAENPNGMMAAATADAMKTAAGNENGALMGFMGMNAGQNVGASAMAAAATISPTTQSTTGAKFCSNCGAPLTGAFCSQCGTKAE
ncbi:MAG: SPFH domain-containing protein [Erysipelotrichales bacterium]|nr:SPFH domain-containing protein [Erysipelotrichales bacterium]